MKLAAALVAELADGVAAQEAKSAAGTCRYRLSAHQEMRERDNDSDHDEHRRRAVLAASRLVVAFEKSGPHERRARCDGPSAFDDMPDSLKRSGPS
jgi:hypothetical protein